MQFLFKIQIYNKQQYMAKYVSHPLSTLDQ